MAIGHIAVRTHKRGAGHSAAAVLAYRHGTALACPRTGEVHDYTRRSGVARCGTVAAVDTPLTQSLDALVAGIEGAERRRDSRISRDVQVALPCELSEPQNYELTQAFAKALAERYHTLASWAVHRPHRNDDGDLRNVHAHIVIPTRALDETGQLGRKLVELDHPKQSRDEIKAIRLLWEETANATLIEAGVSARVDVGRREDGDPAPTLGPTHAAVERKARRQRGHRTTGVPVAELVADGQSVTGRGRRLEKHERRRRIREQHTAIHPTLDKGGDGEVVLESLRAIPEDERAPSPLVRPGQDFGATTAVRAVPEDERAPSPPVFTLTQRGHSVTLHGLHKLHQALKTLNRLRERETSSGQIAARVQARTEGLPTPREVEQVQEYLKGISDLGRPSLRTVIERIAQARLDGTEAQAPETAERQWRIRRVIGPHTKGRPQVENPYGLDRYNRGAVRSPESAEAVARELDRALIRTCKEHYGPESPLGPPPAQHFVAFTAKGKKRKRMLAIDNALRAWHHEFNQFMEYLTRIVIPHEVQIWRDRVRERRRDSQSRQQRVPQGRERSETTQQRERGGSGIVD